MDHLGLEPADDRPGQGVVIRITRGTCGTPDASFCQPLGVTDPLVLAAPDPPIGDALRIERFNARALEQARRLGEKRATAQIVEATMAPDINALEPVLIRQGYTTRALTGTQAHKGRCLPAVALPLASHYSYAGGA